MKEILTSLKNITYWGVEHEREYTEENTGSWEERRGEERRGEERRGEERRGEVMIDWLIES